MVTGGAVIVVLCVSVVDSVMLTLMVERDVKVCIGKLVLIETR